MYFYSVWSFIHICGTHLAGLCTHKPSVNIKCNCDGAMPVAMAIWQYHESCICHHLKHFLDFWEICLVSYSHKLTRISCLLWCQLEISFSTNLSHKTNEKINLKSSFSVKLYTYALYSKIDSWLVLIILWGVTFWFYKYKLHLWLYKSFYQLFCQSINLGVPCVISLHTHIQKTGEVLKTRYIL